MYRTIDCAFWTDDKVRALTADQTLLFLYLITNPHSHYSGLYHLSQPIMQYEVRLKQRFIMSWNGLLTTGLIDYAARFEQVWVKNMFAHQGKGQKCERGVAYHLKTLHHSPLIPLFLDRYPMVKAYCDDTLLIPHQSPIDTLRSFSSPDPGLLTSSPDSDLKSKSCAFNGRNYQEEAKMILAFLNAKTGKKFREVPANLMLIQARLKSGVDVQTCRTLIMRKIHDWKEKPEMQVYLRPETLFGKTKFEGYLAEVTS